MLHITNLSKSYGRKTVIDDVTLSIPSVGLYLVRGENGNGKTTLIKCLAGLERHKGKIRWFDAQMAGNVSAVFDDPALHERLTGLQNLSALLDIPSNKIRDKSIITAFLSQELLNRKSSTYSLGQRKKLKLATAFASGRPCILLDEPISGLDDMGRRALHRALESVAATTCVFVSDHDHSFYRDLSTSTFTIRQGKVLAESKFDE